MKREIKFRYILKNNTGFHYKVYTLKQLEGNSLYALFDLANYELIQRVQYTGLKDKNGVEIYEGDIVRFSIGYEGIEHDRFSVCELMGAFGCRNMKDRAIGFRPFVGMENSLVQHGYYQDLHEIMEVVGNIHESPAPSIAAASSRNEVQGDTAESEQGAQNNLTGTENFV